MPRVKSKSSIQSIFNPLTDGTFCAGSAEIPVNNSINGENMKKSIIVIILCLLPVWLLAELPVGEKPAEITLEGKTGGKVDGSAWSSAEIQGKVYVLFHADPDESETNNAASEALKAEDFPSDKYGSIAIVNMKATWKPAWIISMILKSKQEKYEDTVYVKDMAKLVVKKWNLADDSNNVVLFDQTGTVLYSKDGQLSKSDIDELIKLTWANIK